MGDVLADANNVNGIIVLTDHQYDKLKYVLIRFLKQYSGIIDGADCRTDAATGSSRT